MWFILFLFSRPNPNYQEDSDAGQALISVKRKYAAPPDVNFPGKVLTLGEFSNAISELTPGHYYARAPLSKRVACLWRQPRVRNGCIDQPIVMQSGGRSAIQLFSRARHSDWMAHQPPLCITICWAMRPMSRPLPTRRQRHATRLQSGARA